MGLLCGGGGGGGSSRGWDLEVGPSDEPMVVWLMNSLLAWRHAREKQIDVFDSFLMVAFLMVGFLEDEFVGRHFWEDVGTFCLNLFSRGGPYCGRNVVQTTTPLRRRCWVAEGVGLPYQVYSGISERT